MVQKSLAQKWGKAPLQHLCLHWANVLCASGWGCWSLHRQLCQGDPKCPHTQRPMGVPLGMEDFWEGKWNSKKHVAYQLIKKEYGVYGFILYFTVMVDNITYLNLLNVYSDMPRRALQCLCHPTWLAGFLSSKRTSPISCDATEIPTTSERSLLSLLTCWVPESRTIHWLNDCSYFSKRRMQCSLILFITNIYR